MNEEILNANGEKGMTYGELLKKKKINESELKKIPITKLCLNTRAINAIHYRLKVYTFDQLIQYILTRDLRNVWFIGSQTLQNIAEELNDIVYKIDFKPEFDKEEAYSLGSNYIYYLGPIHRPAFNHIEQSSLWRTYSVEEITSMRTEDMLKCENTDLFDIVTLKIVLAKCGIYFDEDLERRKDIKPSTKEAKVMKEEIMEGEKENKKVEIEEKDELLEKLLTSKKWLGVLEEISCQSFVKGSKEYEKLSATVEAYLNETLKTELEKAKSEADFEKISVLLENMRNSYKDIVNTKRQEIFALEETKAKFAASQKAKNGDVKKYHHKTQTDPDQRHSHNPFAEDLGREL